MSGLSCCFIRVIRVVRGYSPFEVEDMKSPNQTLEPTRVGPATAGRFIRPVPRGSAFRYLALSRQTARPGITKISGDTRP